MATPPATTNHHHHNPPPPPAIPAASSSGSLPMLLPVFILFFILLCFLSIFLFRDLFRYLSATWNSFRRRPSPESGGAAAGVEEAEAGLDPVILASFPTLPYAAVRGLEEGKCGRECAVCLSEFTAGDAVRFLTVCRHAFHIDCIDSWLAAHTTCPLCRSDLKAPPDEAAVLMVKEAVVENHAITIEEAATEMEKPQSVEGSGGRRIEGEEGGTS